MKKIRKICCCGKEFTTYPSIISRGGGKFCSIKCCSENRPIYKKRMKKIKIKKYCDCGKIVYAKKMCRRCYDYNLFINNKERSHKRNKIWNDKHKKQRSIQAKKWRDRNKDKIAKHNHEYAQTPMGKLVGNRKREKRRSRKLNLFETFTTKEWSEKLDKTEGICPGYNRGSHFVGKSKLEMDHIIPISKAPKGFTYTINDMQPLCKSCNSEKGNRVIKYEK